MTKIFHWYMFHLRRSFNAETAWPWQKAWWVQQWNAEKETEKEWWLRHWSVILVILSGHLFILCLLPVVILIDLLVKFILS